ncbi:unnamed protein product, partial [Prorocentrum cordatum]
QVGRLSRRAPGPESELSIPQGAAPRGLCATGNAWPRSRAPTPPRPVARRAAELRGFAEAVSGLTRAGRAAEALELFERARRSHVDPDRVLYNPRARRRHERDLSGVRGRLLRQRGAPSPHPRGRHLQRRCRRASRASDGRGEGVWGAGGEAVRGPPGAHAHVLLWPSDNAAVSACEKASRWDTALSLLREMHILGALRDRSLDPDAATYNAAVGACVDGQQPLRAVDLFEEMQQHGLRPDAISFASAVEACRQTREWAAALRLLERLCHEGVAETTRRLSEPGRRLWDVALALFWRLRASGAHADVTACNAALSACQRGRRPAEALALLREQLLAGEEGCRSFNAAIASCSQGSAWRQALRLFREMRRREVAPDLVTFNSTIHAAGRAAERGEAGASELVAALRGSGLQPDRVTFNVAIGACEREDRWTDALALLTEMEQLELRPNVVTCNSAVGACGAGSRWDLALSLAGSLPLRGLRPTGATFAAAAVACERGRQWQRAVDVLAEMPWQRLKANVENYNSVISACGSASAWEYGTAVLADMQARWVVPDPVTYLAAISACATAGCWEQGLALLDACRARCGATPLEAFNAALSALEKGGQWQRALALFRGMGRPARGRPAAPAPDRVSYLAVLLALCEAGPAAAAALHAVYDEAAGGGGALELHGDRQADGALLLDLHGLPGAVAALAATRELERELSRRAWSGGERVAAFITGRGRRSEGGEAVLRGRVLAALRGRPGAEALVDAANPGCVVAWAAGNQALLALRSQPVAPPCRSGNVTDFP